MKAKIISINSKINRCPYCGAAVHLKDGSTISDKKAGIPHYICSNYPACDSYVGVHKGTTSPFGTLAKKDLRELRVKTHRIFDMLWKMGRMDRKTAYSWLADKLCISSSDCHIGNFREGNCMLTIKYCNEILEKRMDRAA